MFESEFARIEYIPKDNAVFHIWKKEAHFDDYRKPVNASLELLRDHPDSLFIVDARNGFEDVPEDVEWGFQFFLPELQKTGCKIWGFILPEVSEIEGEIDLWTAEIEKNFTVIRAVSYDEVIGKAAEVLRISSESIQEQIERIMYYENIMQQAANGSHELLRELSEEYYGSPAWKRDLAADEAGLLPKDLKRGVLSEDGIYDLLEKFGQ
jgi:hypothetical protein